MQLRTVAEQLLLVMKDKLYHLLQGYSSKNQRHIHPSVPVSVCTGNERANKQTEIITDPTIAAISLLHQPPGPALSPASVSTRRTDPKACQRSFIHPFCCAYPFPVSLCFHRTKHANLELWNSFLLASEEILGRRLSEIDGTLIPWQK